MRTERRPHPWLVAWVMLAGGMGPLVGLAFVIAPWPYWLSFPLGCLAFVTGLVIAMAVVASFKPEWLDA